ncbi:histidine kinase [Nocardioides zeae]|uniref:Histidine kinase n=1 Tax=Nocardioides imazamoxiresistens TaxID=3231893 RepID=A0ABU3PXT2_9ACTN|nr:histidine kinase [Nocardioides zeae]MDT9593969.1 histidine kinase [Nocardioides zeae]
MGRWNGFWTRRTDVQRVELYTKISLYFFVWWMSLTLLALEPRVLERPVSAVVVLGVTLAVGLAATHGLRVTFAHPRPRLESPAVRRAVAVNAVVAAAAVAAGLAIPADPRIMLLAIVASALAWGVGAVRDRVVSVGTGVAVVAAGLLLHGTNRPAIAMAVVLYAFFLFTLRASLWLLDVVTELDEARQAQGQLAVAEERLRFSRDVHDVLGRHLSTIAVRSELAATLAERGDDRAAGEMLEVRAAAQEALREARALARGYRRTDLATELEGARSLLASAGIACDHDLTGVPRPWHEPAGWVIREAVTNVLRHSSATRVEIRWEPGRAGAGRLVVANDGVGDGASEGAAATTGGGGSGILGLGERLAPLGARVETGRGRDGFELAAVLPAQPAATTRPEVERA